MNALKKLAIPLFVALAYGPAQGWATPILGSELATFAVLGASNVTCDTAGGLCIIGGNLGSDPTAPTSPAASFTFSFGSYQPGTQGTAQTQLAAAILAVNAGAGTPIVAGNGNLDVYQAANGGVIAPGVYDVGAGTANLLGDLFLDGGGSNAAVWRFRFSSTLITSTTSNVYVQNVGDGAGVGIYWSVGSAATLNGPIFAGNVLAQTTISSDGDLTLACGRLLSATAAVTLISDTISIGCGNAGDTGFGSSGYDQAGVQQGGGGTAPEPATLALLGLGLAGLGFGRRRQG